MGRRSIVMCAAVAGLIVAGCGSDSKSSATTAAATTAVSSTAVASSTVAQTGSSTPAGGAATSSTNANEAKAAAALLTDTDLAGWKIQADNSDDDGSLQFSSPECAALKALDSDPGLNDDASEDLVSPDEHVQISESVTVSDEATAKKALDTVATPATATCLQQAFTAALQQQQLPAGVSIDGLQFQQQPLQAGDQAISYVGSVGVAGGNANTDLQLGLRMDAVRTGGNLALLFTIALPGGAAVDQTTIINAATAHLAG